MRQSTINRDERRAILAKLIHEMRKEGSWAGETHVNKHTFYLQDLLKCDLGLRFYMHYFGPFSANLSDELRQLRRDGIVRAEEVYGYKPKLYVTDEGQKVAKDAEKWDKQIRWIARWLGRQTAGELEGPSTARLLRSQNEWWKRPKWDDDMLAREIYRLKNHISVDEARVAIRKLDEMVAAAKKDGVIIKSPKAQ